MLVLVASALTVVSLGGLLFAGRFGVLSLYFSKPIIDATWDTTFAGLNLLQIIGVLFPVIVIISSFRNKTKLSEMPFFNLWMIYIIYSAFTYSFLGFESSIVKWFDLTFRALNGLVGFYVLQAYFQEREDFRRLLKVLIVAGIFPLAIGLYQLDTGQIWREHITIGLVRYQGLYHNIISLKTFVFQTITCLFLYFYYFSRDRMSVVMKGFLLVMGLLSLVVLYKCYSKAGIVIVVLWYFIWAISYRKIWPAISVLVVLLLISSFYYQDIVDETTTLFSKEITVMESERPDEYSLERTFQGRGRFWVLGWEEYLSRPLIEQVFGNGRLWNINIHNDFFVKLLSGGVIGLAIYLTLIFLVGKAVYRNWRTRRTPLDVMGLMVFVMLFIDSLGIHVTQYTTYQWYAWGFIGLALAGRKSEKSPQRLLLARSTGLLRET